MSHGFTDDNNPYRATTEQAATVHYTDNRAESIRRAHINHEASVKSIGTLYLLGCILFVFVGFAALTVLGGVRGGIAPGERALIVAIGIFYLSIGVLLGFTTFGLWRLNPWARWVSVAFSATGLIIIPIGTLICGYFLYLLLSEKGTMVFSEEYKQIIAATPDIKYKTSMIVWILLCVLLGLIGLGIAAAFLTGV